ncbi:MAG: hypothetical protein ABJH68_21095 [Ilumatobacter sp.]|uniref:hypothetical protein n=1 Tax=Ilumatobacter sp. TaxID=1967498 RepID=UPI003297643C
MRSIIRSTGQLAELRDQVRRDVAEAGDDVAIVEDFVAAVNEVVAAALADEGDGGSARAVEPFAGASGESAGAAGWSVDVRWFRRQHPRVELYAEIRNVAGTPKSLIEAGLAERLVRHYAERIDFDDRIGGSVITVRCRV